MRSIFQVLMPLLIALLAHGTRLQADPPPGEIEDRGEYRQPQTHDFLLKSRSRKDYRILVAEPAGDTPPDGFPVLYVLDANACFGTIVEAQRLQVRRGATTGVTPAVIVGIAYPGDGPFDTTRRTFDLTTPASADKLPKRPDGSSWPASGGADEFLNFIEAEVKPQVEGRFKIDRKRQSLFGHSLGGLFVLHTLFTKPASFQCYIAASPSVWWNDYALLHEEREFVKQSAQSPVNVRVRITTAELEKGTGPTAKDLPTAASKEFGDSQDLAARLENLADRGLQVEFQEFPGENHGSVLPVALNRGLRFALNSQPKSAPLRATEEKPRAR